MPNAFPNNSGGYAPGADSSQFGGGNFQGGRRALGGMMGARNFQNSPFGLAVDVAGLILAVIALIN